MQRYCGIPAGYEDDEDEVDSIERTARNLKISIVPDITTGAGLHGENFDSQLTVEMSSWFETFTELWNAYKRTPAVQQRIRMVFFNDADPLLLALKLFANCPGCNNLKNKNLALFVLETICDLHKQHPGIAANCDDNTRMVAFNLLKTCGVVSLYKAVMHTYELHKVRDLLVPKLNELIALGYFKDVAYWAMHLQIPHLFDLFDIVFPLILQDKVFLVEEYLNVAKEQQVSTVQFLDSLLDKQKTVYQHCDEILAKYKYKDVRHDILSYRPMSKLVTRLAKKYKIDSHLTPHLNFTKACSYMHYLYRKYQDDGMSAESWRELVRDAAGSKALQLDLVINIASYGDIAEAVYWAKYFKVPPEECPNNVQMQLKSDEKKAKSVPVDFVDPAPPVGAVTKPKKIQSSSSSSSSNASKQFLTLQLPAECVILVDVKLKFHDMMRYLEAQTLIAFDSEWKPSVCNDNVVSLLQLATYERVYLLDCLSPHLSADLWQLLGRSVFNNLEILKVGFSLHQDLRMLHRSLPLHLNLQASAGYLDLRELWRQLKCMQIVSFPRHAGESLCVLTEVCLGKKLDKSNQCSNWANRPLRRDQIAYAALDAHCLLQIYQVFTELLLRMGLDIEQVVEEITTAKTGYLFRMKRTTAEQNVVESGEVQASYAQTQTEGDVIRATDIKFICDVMLLGLSKELRKLGIDCIEVKTVDVSYYIELAKQEKRYILTRDERYALFAAEIPTTQCIHIPTDSSVEQVLNLMQYLRIQVHERNLFTRCLQCNSNEFILALKNEMHMMRFGLLPDLGGNARSSKNLEAVDLYDRTYNLLNLNEHIINTKTTYRGKPIKLNRIKPNIFRYKEHFFICDNCGVCTWDGAHGLPSSIMNLVVTAAGFFDTDQLTSSATK